MRPTNQKNEQIPENMHGGAIRFVRTGDGRTPAEAPIGIRRRARDKIGPPAPNEAHRPAAPRGQTPAETDAQIQWSAALREDTKWTEDWRAGGVAKDPPRPPKASSESPPEEPTQADMPCGPTGEKTGAGRNSERKSSALWSGAKHRADGENQTGRDDPPEDATGNRGSFKEAALVQRPSVFARQDPQWESFEIGPPRRAADELTGADADSADEKRKPCTTTKTSAGVLLCRVNPHTNRPEVILVHKRYTYAFSEFVYGRYSRQNQKNLMALFEQMTAGELLDIWSLNFEQMWYRIWLTGPRRELFTKKHTKFYTSFIRDDGGRALQQMLRQVQDRGVPFWEIPKGRPNGKEGDLVCAMREFTEETGVEKKDYRLLPGVKRRVTFVHMGVRYVHVYYVAVASSRLYSEARTGWRRPVVPGRGVLSTADFMGEVDEVRWMDIEHVRFVDDGSGHLEAIIAPAFRLVKRFLGGRWDQRRARPANISGLDPGVIGALASLVPAFAAAESDANRPEGNVGGRAPHGSTPLRGPVAQWEAKPRERPATKNPGNDVFRALLSLEYGQETRRAARRVARRQRAAMEKKTQGLGAGGPRSAEGAAQGAAKQKRGGVHGRGAPPGRVSAVAVYEEADGDRRPPQSSTTGDGGDGFGNGPAPSRSQSPAPGGEPRPSTPDQAARRAAAAISRSRTPSAEALLKNLTLTEICLDRRENTTAVLAPEVAAGAAPEEKATQAQAQGQNKKQLLPAEATGGVGPVGASGPAPLKDRATSLTENSYVGALGLGSGPHCATQASSATDDEAYVLARGRRPPVLGKCESLGGTGRSRPRGVQEQPANTAHSQSNKVGPYVGSPSESRKAASSADEGWSFVQRRGGKKKQTTGGDARPVSTNWYASAKTASRRSKKDR